MISGIDDDKGKEAFAYLAVLLMISSTAFAVYAGFLDSERRRMEMESMMIGRMSHRFRDLEASIRSNISGEIDLIFSEIERESILNLSDVSIEGRLYPELVRRIPDTLQKRADHMNGSGEGALFFVEGTSIDVIPNYVGVEGVAPSSDPEYDNVTGLIEIGDRCEILSVSIFMDIELRSESSDGGYRNEIDLRLEFRKPTLSEFLRSRQTRLQDAAESGEFDRLFSYLLTSLVQQKSLMGYGRKISNGETGYSPPLITESEIETVADLAVCLLVQAHLRSDDPEFLDGISTGIMNFPGAGGSTVPLGTLFRQTKDPYDPAGLIPLSAGFGSEGNPPSLEMIVRPLILSIADRLVSKFLVYTGTFNSNLAKLGGIIEIYRLSADLVDESLEEIGIDIIEDAEMSAWDMFTNILDTGGFDTSGGISLMNRRIESVEYNGEEIMSYPLIDLGVVERTFDVYLTQDSPDRIFYVDGEGNRHSADEYSDPADEYFAHRCEVYRLKASFEMQEIEPGFQPVLLDHHEDFRKSLLSLLGTDDSDLDLRYEDLARQGNIELRNALDKTISRLSDGANGELWDIIYVGWNESDPPSLTDGIHPITEYLALNVEALERFMDPLVGSLRECLISGDYFDRLSDFSNGLGELIAVWLNDTYDIWTERDLKIRSAGSDIRSAFLYSCSAEVASWESLGSGFITGDRAVFPPEGVLDIEWVIVNRDILVEKGLSENIGTSEGDDLDHLIELKLHDSYDLIKDRECSMESGNLGVFPRALMGSTTRGNGSIFDGIWDLPAVDAARYLLDVVNSTYSCISRDLMRPYGMSGGVTFMASPPGSDLLTPHPWQEKSNVDIGSFQVSSSINRTERSIVKRSFSGGEYNTAMKSDNSSYRSFMSVSFECTYRVGYSAEGKNYNTLGECVSEIAIDAFVDVELDTSWPLEGVTYSPVRTILDDILDNGKRAAMLVLRNLTEAADEYLGGTMGSVTELPPLLVDLASGEDIDLTEISRVLTNISMELSQKIREGLKGIVKHLIETGISIALSEILRAFDIDRIQGSLRFGGLTLDLISEVNALMNGSGKLLWIGFAVPSIGTEGSMDIQREDNGTLRYNGTIRIEIGDLSIRIEIDPFMEARPHILSIEGRLDRGGELLRFSVLFPDIDVYRSSEISLGSSLGISPMVFIPPIGMSAVFDGGFRIRYMKPAELKPHLNELRFSDANLTGIEIYNPLGFVIGGYILEIRTADDRHLSSVYLDGGNGIFEWFEIDTGGESIEIGSSGLELILRDPSGRILDDVALEQTEDDFYSRESDGWGVWRWCEGSPGSPNGRTGQFSFTSLLLGIVVSSLKEAWNEAYSLHGLTFQTLSHFIERAVDLFVERALSAVGELVLDVRLFIDIKIAAGAGVSAGLGIEIAFLAEGDAVARFLNWVYDNVKIFLGNLMNPGGAGDYTRFPLEILSDCYLEASFFFEVETPQALSKMAPEGANIPTTLNLGVSGRMSISLPLILAGVNLNGWEIGAGVYIVDAPPPLISMFYEIPPATDQVDLWILRAFVWSEG
ncbi:MAG: hypothetical protein ACMUIG_08710 [Thermoplasmatota archaeon]